jgi:FKBP-type peptidyl-prolyl cis-trans isomerase SlyD
MTVAPNFAVFLTYELSTRAEAQDWDMVEVVTADEPMAFIMGMSGLPESFEEKLIGLSANDTFDFTLSADDGYGAFDEEAVVDLPLDLFKVEGQIDEDMLQVGNVLPMTNEEGHQMRGQIVEVGPDFVMMDFNHPLAGREMWFKGQIVSVRPATESELDHGHIHGTGGVEH